MKYAFCFFVLVFICGCTSNLFNHRGSSLGVLIIIVIINQQRDEKKWNLGKLDLTALTHAFELEEFLLLLQSYHLKCNLTEFILKLRGYHIRHHHSSVFQIKSVLLEFTVLCRDTMVYLQK